MALNLTTASRFIAARRALADPAAPDLSTFLVESAEVGSLRPDGVRLVLRAAPAGSGDGHEGYQAHVDLTVHGEGILKVSWLLDADSPATAATLPLVRGPVRQGDRTPVVRDGSVVIDAGAVAAVVTLDPFHLRIVDTHGHLLTEQLASDLDSTKNRRSLPIGWSTIDGRRVWHETLRVRPDERFHGLGEAFTPIERTGRHVVMWTNDTFGTGSDQMYKPVPYLSSTAGYAVMVNSGSPVEFDVAATSNAALSILVPDDVMEYFVMGGPTVADALLRSRALTGPLLVPPRWALGSWMSTGFLPQTQDSVLEVARALRGNGFPGDVIHIDPYWMRRGQWCDLRWDREAFPDPPALLSELRSLGLRTCLWINPYVSVASDLFAEGDARGYFLRRTDGTSWTGSIWGDDVPHPEVAIVDFTSPAARVWYADLLAAVLRDGVAAFKTDFGEAVPEDVVSASGLTGTDLHNIYPLLYNDVVADTTAAVTGESLVWGRSSFLGGQRHVAQWGGDTPATWAGMAASLRGGLSYSLSGYSFWAHDVGGYDGAPTPELFRRWAQWGAVSPLTRLHGTSSRIPWEWDEQTCESVRRSLLERYRYLPHLWSESVATAAAGLPVAQPLPLAVPGDPGLSDTDSCYLLGHDLLVAPARDEEGHQLAYLPAAADWIDHATGERFAGGRWVRRVLPEQALPVFVRAGAIIPTTPGIDRVPDGPFTALVLELWGSPDVDPPTSGVAWTREIHDVNGTTAVTVRVVAGTLAVDSSGPASIHAVVLRKEIAGVGLIRLNGQEAPVDGANDAMGAER